jgi:hypothetical protein
VPEKPVRLTSGAPAAPERLAFVKREAYIAGKMCNPTDNKGAQHEWSERQHRSQGLCRKKIVGDVKGVNE